MAARREVVLLEDVIPCSAFMLKRTQRDARSVGEKFYFTGFYCPRGHMSKRYTCIGKCVACSIEDRKANPEGKKEDRRTRYIANKSDIRAKNDAWAAQNRDKVRAIKKRWRDGNKEWTSAWAIARRGRDESVERFTAAHARNIIARQKGKCACCGNRARLEMDHIMPVALGGNSAPSNFQGLCQPCNRRKSSKHPADFNRSRGLLL